MSEQQRRTRRQFTQEFKRDAVQLVRTSGRPIAEIARDLGVYDSTLGTGSSRTAYGLHDEPIEAVISVRPTSSNVLVFETYEGDPTADQDDQLASQGRPVQPPAARDSR
jgi:hypothetical protein